MNWKRVLAVIGLVLILALYAIALISAFSRSPESKTWLMAAVFSSVIIPVVIYAAQLVYRMLKPGDKDKTSDKESNAS